MCVRAAHPAIGCSIRAGQAVKSNMLFFLFFVRQSVFPQLVVCGGVRGAGADGSSPCSDNPTSAAPGGLRLTSEPAPTSYGFPILYFCHLLRNCGAGRGKRHAESAHRQSRNEKRKRRKQGAGGRGGMSTAWCKMVSIFLFKTIFPPPPFFSI